MCQRNIMHTACRSDFDMQRRHAQFTTSSCDVLSCKHRCIGGATDLVSVLNSTRYPDHYLSSRSALTFIPPVTRHSVSRPLRSVTWTNVSLKLYKLLDIEFDDLMYEGITWRRFELPRRLVRPLELEGPEIHSPAVRVRLWNVWEA